MAYRNFEVAIYCPVGDLLAIDDFAAFGSEFDELQRDTGVSKVYLETFREGTTIPRETMQRVVDFFKGRGISVAGGITPVAATTPMRAFTSFCYTDPKTREFFADLARFTASFFDEIILDDFYFTNCKCERCISTKGDQSWAEFRVKLLRDFSRDVLIPAAKSVNPNVKMVIKFPNWYESFQEAGYDLAGEPELFDGVYTGTETRNPAYTQQHLPKALSYLNLRYIDNCAPGKNGGGWFDTYETTYNLTSYVQQAQLTLFAKPAEVTLFALDLLLDPDYSLCAPVVGRVFRDLDRYLDKLGEPIGTVAYRPLESHGEDYLMNYLGMLGIPLEPTPRWSASLEQPGSKVFLAESAAQDPETVAKMHRSLLAGADVVVTSGFAKVMKERGFDQFMNLDFSGRKAEVNRYALTTDGGLTFGEYVGGPDRVLIPQISYMTNDTWALIAGLGVDNNFPILLKSEYGNGRVFVLTIPDDFGQLYAYPREVLAAIREVLAPPAPVVLDAAAEVALFSYDNDTFILYSFLPYVTEVRLTAPGTDRQLTDLVKGDVIAGYAPVGERDSRHSYASDSLSEVSLGESGKTEFRLSLLPAVPQVFKLN